MTRDELIREVMHLVDAYGNAVEDNSRGRHASASAENAAYSAIEEKIKSFASLVAAKEREACLAAARDTANKLIRPLEDVNLDTWHVRRLQEQSNGAMKAYEAIRARGQEAV